MGLAEFTTFEMDDGTERKRRWVGNPYPHAVLSDVLIDDPSPECLEQIFRLRVEAWRPQAQVHPGVSRWTDAWDAVSRHRVLIAPNGEVAGAFRFSLHDNLTGLPDGEAWAHLAGALPLPLAYFSRMFVAPGHQGRGLGRVLDRLAIDAPRDAGAASVVMVVGTVMRTRARGTAIPALGWSRLGLGRVPKATIYTPCFAPSVFAIRFDGRPVVVE